LSNLPLIQQRYCCHPLVAGGEARRAVALLHLLGVSVPKGNSRPSAFLAWQHTDARLIAFSPGHLLPAGQRTCMPNVTKDNPVHDPDGFYYALLEKKAA
jgi:hypothetical protein